MKCKEKIVVFVAIIIFISLLIFAAIYDLEISILLADIKFGEYFSQNIFGQFIEIFGEIPIYLFLCYAFSVVFWNAFYYGKLMVRYVLCPIVIIILAVVCYYIPNRIHEYIFELNLSAGKGNEVVANVLIGVMIGAISIVGVLFTGKLNIKKQLSFAIVILFVAATSQLFTQGLKVINKRVRFRAMNALGDYNYDFFTPWYQINGFPEKFRTIVEQLGGDDGIRSFPSGHTTAAGITYSLLALPYVFKRFNGIKSKIVFLIIGVFYTAMVAIGRIVMGAHYFSDVLVGGSISFFLAVFSIWIVYKKKLIKPLIEYCGMEC